MIRESRGNLLRWGGWFAAFNALVMAIVGLRYLWRYPFPSEPMAQLYTGVAYIGHFASLSYLAFVLVLLPVTLLLPVKRLILSLGVSIASVGIALLVLDSMLFARNHFHLNGLTIAVLEWTTWGFGAIYVLILLVLESLIAKWTWSRFGKPATRRRGWWVAAPLLVCFLASQGLHVWADARYYVPITRFTHYLPVFHPLKAKRVLVELGIVDMKQSRERRMVQELDPSREGTLRYPLAPLECAAPRPELNVVIIIVDAMRADMLAKETAPAMVKFAERAVTFENHYSGGNSSRAGLFSLFYGLPGTYWSSFAATRRPPVLMDKFQEHDYQLGIYVSAPMYHAVSLDRTAFARVPDLRMESLTKWERVYRKDQVLTAEWLDWLDARDPARPFFGFLYYGCPTSKDFPPDYPYEFRSAEGAGRAERLYARYRTAVHFDDSLIGTVLDDLRDRELMDETVVILTADHGAEFDESGLGFVGHGSGYSRYQMHVPMIVHWPGREKGSVDRRSSHFDIPATLLAEVFGCTNAASDFSSGTHLFSGASWDWLIAGSYANFAVIEPTQTTVSYRSGYFEIRDPDYRVISRPIIHRDVISEAMNEMGRFYQK